MTYRYRATHSLRITLDTPIPVEGRDPKEITHITVEADWVLADPDDNIDRDGWLLSWSVQGYPLTSKGVRDKRVKAAESIILRRYPEQVWIEAHQLFAALRRRAHLNEADVINLDEGLLDSNRYERVTV